MRTCDSIAAVHAECSRAARSYTIEVGLRGRPLRLLTLGKGGSQAAQPRPLSGLVPAASGLLFASLCLPALLNTKTHFGLHCHPTLLVAHCLIKATIGAK